MRKKGVVRTCIACRTSGSPDDLIRLVRSPQDSVVVDLAGKLPGRGAWVHCSRQCVGRVDGRTLSRSLGTTAGDGVALHADIEAAIVRALRAGMSMAAAGGAVVGGHQRVLRAIRDGTVRYVVIAEDASERTIRDLKRESRATSASGQEGEEPVVQPGTVSFVDLPIGKEELGRLCGKGERAAVAVFGSRASGHLLNQLRRLLALR